jgi:hypothetical protein
MAEHTLAVGHGGAENGVQAGACSLGGAGGQVVGGDAGLEVFVVGDALCVDLSDALRGVAFIGNEDCGEA